MKYVYRGMTLLKYREEDNQLEAGLIHECVPCINMARMTTEDYFLMAKFFIRCYKHSKGDKRVVLEDIKVQ